MTYKEYQYPMPEEKQVRVITDTDAANEGDDQFAIVHTLLSSKFDNVAMIAAHFGTRNENTMQESYDELVRIFGKMGFDPEGVVVHGARHALPDEKTPVDSEGARRIIAEAMSDDPRPLYVTFLGPLTDLASAYLLEPRIAGRLKVIWIGGGTYPVGAPEFNLGNDVNAVNVVMQSEIELWQVPKNVYEMMPVSMAELEYRVSRCGEIGKYLFDQLVECSLKPSSLRSAFRTGETWVLGDSPAPGLILYEHRWEYDLIPAPRISENMTYIPGSGDRKIRVYRRIDSRLILEDMYCKLALFAERHK